MELADSNVLITGGAGGIGMATARRLLGAGARVVLWDVGNESLDAARATLVDAGFDAAGIETDVVDITDAAAVARAARRLAAGAGVPEAIVNNAGHLAPGDFLDQPAEVWEATVRVNLTGVVNVTRAFLPYFYERDRGHVVNISSASSFVGVSGLAVYSATKWAVWGLTEALRHEAVNHGKHGVRFSSIHPNYIARGMFEGARITGLGGLVFPRLRDHDVVARAVVEDALRRGKRIVRRPRSLRLAVTLRGLLPDALFALLARALNVHSSMSGWTGSKGSAA